MRALTIAASILLAFVCQWDAVEIFHHVSVNASTRSSLVASAEGVVRQADGILLEKGDLVQRIADDWKTAYPDGALPAGETFSNVGQLERRLQEIAIARGTYLWKYVRHSPGMLIFAGFLTLGAPYWYNVLKNLTSLRPALAQVIGKEEAQRNPPPKR